MKRRPYVSDSIELLLFSAVYLSVVIGLLFASRVVGAVAGRMFAVTSKDTLPGRRRLVKRQLCVDRSAIVGFTRRS